MLTDGNPVCRTVRHYRDIAYIHPGLYRKDICHAALHERFRLNQELAQHVLNAPTLDE
jgi:hypothetical protein